MQRNYKLIVSIIALTLSSICTFAQEKVEYKDVILDGKPAKLNVATGEITLVNTENKKKVPPLTEPATSQMDEAEVSSDESDFYIVKEGETLFKIAKRFNTSLTELKKANNLETTLINKGQKLVIKNFELHKNLRLSENEILYNNTSNFHLVNRGETLYSIAKKYKLTINELKSKNSLNTDLIKVGQKLKIRDLGISNEIDNMSVWTVVKGDTLYSIAKQSGISVDKIIALNKLTSNILMEGQILLLK
jgi:LysM repeat protein